MFFLALSDSEYDVAKRTDPNIVDPQLSEHLRTEGCSDI